MEPLLFLRFFGKFELRCLGIADGAAEPRAVPATLKAQSLFAYLVVHRHRSHSRNHLAALFWGDSPERQALHSLANALWSIRHCLPRDDFILADTANIQFDPYSAFWLDVADFETLAAAASDASLPPAARILILQQAVDLHRGDFLEGFYDEWVLDERSRLQGIFLDLLALLMTDLRVAGKYEQALDAALHLLDYDPLREDAHRVAMEAYCHLGRCYAALAQFSRCRRVLQAELGIEPLPETLALRQAIVEGCLGHTPKTAAGPAPVASQSRGHAWDPLDGAAYVPLVGREQELDFLDGVWRAAMAAQCSLVLISGEAGVGKSRLVQEFTDRQRWQGIQIMYGRCYEFEQSMPYQPLAEALESLPPRTAWAAGGSGPAWVTAHMARLAPHLFEPEADLGGTAIGPVGEGRERLFAAVAHFLAQLAGQSPLLLILEDLHWANVLILQLLHHLARHLVDSPLLLVGTWRSEPGALAKTLATLGRRLERDGSARRLRLSRLSANDVVALIGQLSGESEVVHPLADRLYQKVGGNPFYLIETIKVLFERGTLRVETGVWCLGDREALSQDPLPLPRSVSEMMAARAGRRR